MPFKKKKRCYVWVPDGDLRISTPVSPTTGTNINQRLNSLNNARQGVQDLKERQRQRNEEHRRRHEQD